VKEEEQTPNPDFVPDEGATYVAEEEDIKHTSYNVEVVKGTVELWEYFLETTKGLASLAFQNLKCEFIPQIDREVLIEPPPLTDGTNAVAVAVATKQVCSFTCAWGWGGVFQV